MERIISPEERIRRAEEIYYRRKAQGVRVSTTTVNVGKKNKVSLGKKMIAQIIVCILIYTAFYMIKGYNNVFSENVINNTKNILNYDINFQNLYNQFMEYFNNNFNNILQMDKNLKNQEQNESNVNEGEEKDNIGNENKEENENNRRK